MIYGSHPLFRSKVMVLQSLAEFGRFGRIRLRCLVHRYITTESESIYFFDMVWEIFDMAGRDF